MENFLEVFSQLEHRIFCKVVAKQLSDQQLWNVDWQFYASQLAPLPCMKPLMKWEFLRPFKPLNEQGSPRPFLWWRQLANP